MRKHRRRRPSAKIFLVQGEEHEEAKAESGQRADGLLLLSRQLLLFEEFHDLGFDWTGIVPWREREDTRESGQKRVTGEIRAHNGNDEFLALQRVPQFIAGPFCLRQSL